MQGVLLSSPQIFYIVCDLHHLHIGTSLLGGGGESWLLTSSQQSFRGHFWSTYHVLSTEQTWSLTPRAGDSHDTHFIEETEA